MANRIKLLLRRMWDWWQFHWSESLSSVPVLVTVNLMSWGFHGCENVDYDLLDCDAT